VEDDLGPQRKGVGVDEDEIGTDSRMRRRTIDVEGVLAGVHVAAVAVEASTVLHLPVCLDTRTQPEPGVQPCPGDASTLPYLPQDRHTACVRVCESVQQWAVDTQRSPVLLRWWWHAAVETVECCP
jgi:hypothetical protein